MISDFQETYFRFERDQKYLKYLNMDIEKEQIIFKIRNIFLKIPVSNTIFFLCADPAGGSRFSVFCSWLLGQLLGMWRRMSLLLPSAN